MSEGFVYVNTTLERMFQQSAGVAWDERFVGPRAAAFVSRENGIVELLGTVAGFKITLMANQQEKIGSMRIENLGPAPCYTIPLMPYFDKLIDDRCDTFALPDRCQVWAVGWSEVRPEYRMHGFGTTLYEIAWHVTTALGGYLASDHTRSGFAERVWRGFASAGRAVCAAARCGQTGEFYAEPHRVLYVEAVEQLAGEWKPEVDKLDDLRRAARRAVLHGDEDAADELEEKANETEETLIKRANKRAHEINLSAPYPDPPDDDDDEDVRFLGGEDLTDDDPIVVGTRWPCYRYVLYPPTVVGRTGLRGLGQRLLGGPPGALPHDDAADFG